MKILLLFLLAVAFVSPVWAKKATKETEKSSEVVWKNPSGKILKDVAERKSKNGFGGWIILTDDLGWERQWNSKSSIPNFKIVNEIGPGKAMELLIVFSNPKVNSFGNSNLRYDVSIVKPTGKVDIIHSNDICFSGHPPAGRGLAMCGAAVRIAMDASDPVGEWKFEVMLKDIVGGTVLDLSTVFKLK